MHILMLPAWFANRWEEKQTSGNFFKEQAHIMRHWGSHQINIFYPQITSVVSYWRKHRLVPDYKGLDIIDDNGMGIWIDYRSRWVGSRKTASIAAIKRIWTQYTKKYGRPDVVWLQSVIGANVYIAQYLRETLNIPFFIVEHSARFFRPLSTSRQQTYKQLFSNALFVAPVSNFLKQSLNPLCSGSIVLHNPVASVFYQNNERIYNTDERFCFYSIGRLEKDKGHEITITAFSRLVTNGFNCRLVIVGEGSLSSALRKQAQTMGVADAVRFAGVLERQTLADELSQADAYVSASAHETFNLSLAEALVCGLPSVSTPTGIAMDVIDDSNGVITEGFSEKDLFAGMRTVHKNKYDPKTITRNARSLFSPQQYAKSLNHLINQNTTR